MLMGRYKNLTAESKNLLVGNYGKTPVAPDPELVQMALKSLNMEHPVTERPADLIPNELPQIEEELKRKLGADSVDIDDVLTYAMFPQIALKFFETRANGPVSFDAQTPAAAAPAAAKKASTPENYVLNINSKDFKVAVGDSVVMVDGKECKVAVCEEMLVMAV
ncbi:Conserved carboxylase domain-containing protein [Formivibrio citricus]|uniref:Conserved carboxylase domain-containing protein n=1 Tax=Formivibrio citricus TaxID=83765 RepID=A0A1I5CJN4_9NEIS|nr:Conserved carboxylase domain-containing protein [Formivibrio citricus]